MTEPTPKSIVRASSSKFPLSDLIIFVLVIGALQRVFLFLPDPNLFIMFVVTSALIALLVAVAAGVVVILLKFSPGVSRSPGSFKFLFNKSLRIILIICSLSLMSLGILNKL